MSYNKDLDIKNKLSNDEVIFKEFSMSSFFSDLERKYNIITVEDYINFDFKGTKLGREKKSKFLAVQEILKSEYLKKPLAFNEILNKKYPNYRLEGYDYYNMVDSFFIDINELGFYGSYGYSKNEINNYIEKKYKKNDFNISIIGYILDRYSFNKSHPSFVNNNNIGVALTEFYSNFYNEKLKNTKPQEDYLINDSTLDLLKGELENLIKIKDNLDARIIKLSEIIENYERNQAKILQKRLKDEQ